MATILITDRFWLNHEIVEIQMGLLRSFARSLAYYRTIHQDCSRLNTDKEFWCHIINTCLLRAITDWCKVFGPDSNESHWKNISDKHKTEVSTEVRTLILKAGNFPKREWNEYWELMCEIRHKHIAHTVPGFSGLVPHMDKALNIAIEYFGWLIEQLRPLSNEPKQLNVLYSEFQIEAFKVMDNCLRKTLQNGNANSH